MLATSTEASTEALSAAIAPPASLLDSPRWALAATLRERLAARPAGQRGEPADPALAEARLRRWREQSPFDQHPHLWQQRLALAGIDEDELRRLLGESAEIVASYTDRPAWLDALAAAYGHGGVTPSFPWPSQAQLDRCHFLPFVEPLVWHYCAMLDREAAGLLKQNPHAPFQSDIARVLTAHLPDLLGPMLNRVMLVELHVLKLEEALVGDTPEARFADFLARLRQRDFALEVLERYPVLARHLVEKLSQWHNACAELLRHLTDDLDLVASHFFQGHRPGLLREVGGALSDSHRDGRSVFLLAFDSGRHLVYKPKPMKLETEFQDLLGWLAERGFEPAPRRVGVLDRGDYGWMERVHPAPCTDEAALGRFFERQGGYLALLYTLDATDFHHENLMAVGEHPILIDLETLFQPWLAGRSLEGVARLPGAPLRSTVLRPNMLPERWWGDQENRGVDLSGLTAAGDQLTPRPMLAQTDIGLDTMRMERRRLRIPVAENRARLEGREISPLAFAGHLERGFVRVYDLIAGHREEFRGRLEAFADCEMRILFRTTASYGILMLEACHPHALGNALERERLYDRLWSQVPKRPYLAELAVAEMAEMHAGDIPLFVSQPASRDAVDWRGPVFPGIFEDSGLERVGRKLDQLGPADRERQLAVIRDSFLALRLGVEPLPRPSYALRPRPERPSAGELLAAARRAADRIVARCFENELEAHWLIVDHREPNGWQLVPAGPDFYLGLPGIALSLGYLGEALGEPRYAEVARKALFAQKRQLEADREAVKCVGGFNGWGGILYALCHLGRLWGDPSLLDEAESYAAFLGPKIADDPLLDVIAGSAGCFFGLEALAAVRPSAHVEALIDACGERLLAKAEAQPQGGLGWVMPLAGDRALAGLSHGAAGIALALLRLAERRGDERYRVAALGGIAFERAIFDPERGNWPDLRVDPSADAEAEGRDASHGRFMAAWCHGAPGVGLARVAGLPYLDDAEVRAEIATAVATTRAHGFGENHCLCHGDLGNVELLFAVARESGEEALEAEAWALVGGVLDSFDREGFLFGLPGNLETPGLMGGLAGLGYALARLARPDLLPNLLLLEGFRGPDRLGASNQEFSSPASAGKPLADLAGHAAAPKPRSAERRAS